ncbi:TDP-N-acetylfucosamine:lipid II N-acetylfucosaminyltransferase [Salinivirga cyanobacteriivorans]|nr:TDP-N-acetylfucosamine:lipid II N-acetylfucosaminyltransferase [Salinivirga cyanobacteriivorans]
MPQDKFIDSFIADVYTIGEQHNNVFWIHGNNGEKNYVNTVRPVEYIGHDQNNIKRRLGNISIKDKIFIHGYNLEVGEYVYDMPNTIFVWLWGYEFYEEPKGANDYWLYDSITKKILRKHRYPRIRFRKNILKILPEVIDVYKEKKRIKKELVLKNKQISRIDYLVLHQRNIEELLLIKKLYPNFKAKHIPGFYDINYDLAKNVQIKKAEQKEIKILVGNSANPANNHVDAFNKLKKYKNIKVHCILSYGAGSGYIKDVEKIGYKYFANRFQPIKSFMARNDYVNFLGSIDVFFMYHNRQQAFGNIMTAIALGKSVFLKKNNPLFFFIEGMGIKCYDAERIKEYNLPVLIKKGNDRRSENLHKLKNHISDKARLSNLKEILNRYA